MNFRDAVKFVKFQENCTQTDIANQLNVTKSYLSDVLRGRNSASDKLIIRLINSFPYLYEKMEIPPHIQEYIKIKREKEKEPQPTPQKPCFSNSLSVDNLTFLIENQKQFITSLQETIAQQNETIRRQEEIIQNLSKKETSVVENTNAL
jgi:transcriptional regulator with XRE-family HTH domain